MPFASFLKLPLKKVWCHFLQEAQWDYKQAINISEPRPHRGVAGVMEMIRFWVHLS